MMDLELYLHEISKLTLEYELLDDTDRLDRVYQTMYSIGVQMDVQVVAFDELDDLFDDYDTNFQFEKK